MASQCGSALFYPQLRFLVSGFIKIIFPLERGAHRGFRCEGKVWEAGRRCFLVLVFMFTFPTVVPDLFLSVIDLN